MTPHPETQLLSWLAPSCPFALLLTDKFGEICYFNERLAEILGAKPDPGAKGKDFLRRNLIPVHEAPGAREFLTLSDGERRSRRIRLRRQVLRDEAGRPTGAVTVLQTVTDESNLPQSLKRAHLDLIEAREAAMHSLRVKSDFLSNMSHEIRTPLNAIMGMAELLNETELSAAQTKLVEVLLRGGKALLGLVNDILCLSQLESGRVPLDNQPFHLHTLIRALGDTGRALARDKDLEVAVAIAPDLPEVVSGDDQRLEQVLLNFLSNAIKFTRSGRVCVEARPAPETHPGSVTFTVRDTGIGIPGERLNEIFERFSQIHETATKSQNGTGLGLAISKHIVDMMQGSIRVESELGRGSAFHCTVPLPRACLASAARVPAAQPEELDTDILKGLRVLVVEDSEDNAFLISLFLKDCDCRLDYATNGKEALHKFANFRYDLVLMDIQMPVMDGYSATRWIRVLEKAKPFATPILALTAFSQATEVRKSLDAGCDGHLSKPLTKPLLLKTMIRLHANARLTPPPAPPTELPRPLSH